MIGTKGLTSTTEAQRLVVAGQACWPDPSIDARCISCVFAERRRNSLKFYFCRKATTLSGGVRGRAFEAADTHACRYYEPSR
jgi:hypothetical protein